MAARKNLPSTSSSSSSSTTSEENKRRMRRLHSRSKEAKRTAAINEGFEKLLESIPYVRPDQREKMPKIKTLRLAMKYISHLKQVLEGQWGYDCNTFQTRPVQIEDFQPIADEEVKMKNTYCERAQQFEMDKDTVVRIKARSELARKRPRNVSANENYCFPNCNPISISNLNSHSNSISGGSSTSPPSFADFQPFLSPPMDFHNYFSPSPFLDVKPE